MIEKEKRIMILGAGRGQVGLYQAAKKMGYRSIAVSIPGDYPGFKIADEIYYMDLHDADGIANLAHELDIDGIATACLEIGLPAIGSTCDQYGLYGISLKSAMLSTNKLLMKQALVDASVNTAKYIKVSSIDDLQNAISELKMPVIIKAVDLSGSRGINIATNEDELISGYKNTMNATKKDYCIIAEFITGYGCGCTAMVVDNEVSFILPTGDIRKGLIPIGHYLPFTDKSIIMQRIEQQITMAIHALELNNCLINADIMICEDTPYVLEITGRLGANAIPELTSIHLGIDIYEVILDIALGHFNKLRTIDWSNLQYVPCMSQMIISEESGTINTIKTDNLNNENINQLWFFVDTGSVVKKFEQPKDCIGQIVVSGDSIEQCEAILKKSLEEIKVSLIK